MNSNLETKKNDGTKPLLNPQKHLNNFYSRRYTSEKHDSPEESRTSMIRRIRNLILEGKIVPAEVLDIGSGPQSLEKQLFGFLHNGGSLKKMVQVVSIDLANILPRRLLARKIQNVQHVQGNAVKLPFADQSFGLVVSNHAIDFCPQEEAFREAYRVLNNGGKGIFYLHHPSMFEYPPLNEEVVIFWQYLKDNHILFSNEQDIRTFLKRVGFISAEISLKTDKLKTDKWWEVVAEK